MKNELPGIIRLILILILIGYVASFCYAEASYEAAETTQIEEATPVTIEAKAPQMPPQIEAEEEQQWTSLGDFKLTAYCACETCCGYWATIRPIDENGTPIVYTASGAIAETGITIAVDPNIIPYGTEVKINEHIYIAQDTGGAIKGNRIDVYHDDHDAARAFAVREAEVFVKAK